MDTLTLIAAFLIAALSGMGVGSGGLLVVYLTMFCGVSQIRAQGLNLVFFMIASLSSMTVHLLRRKISFLHIGIVVVTGILFALPGSRAALLLDENLVRNLFGWMLILSGTASLFRRSTKKSEKKE